MSITGAQTTGYSGLAFGAHLEKPDKNHVGTEKRSFHGLLEQTSREQQRSASEEMESSTKAEVEEAKKLAKNYQTALVKEILYGTSNAEYWAKKKKSKKYQLFKADNGVFGDKTLEELVNPSDNPKVTWNSAESKKLTKDQARYLKEKYNITDLSNEEQGGLITELIDMQVLSREEADRLLLRQTPLELLKQLMEDEDYRIFKISFKS